MSLVENKKIKWRIFLHRYLIYFPPGGGGNFLVSLTAKFLGYNIPTKFSATGNSHDHGKGEWEGVSDIPVCLLGDHFALNYRANCIIYGAHSGPLLKLKQEYENLKIIMITAEDDKEYWNIARMMARKAWPIFLTYPGEYEKLKGEDWPEYEENLPNKISFLRLDTDIYQTTKKQLEVLYDKLVPGGVLHIDDYGICPGVKTAVDNFFSNKNIWLHRVDMACRYLIKK